MELLTHISTISYFAPETLPTRKPKLQWGKVVCQKEVSQFNHTLLLAATMDPVIMVSIYWCLHIFLLILFQYEKKKLLIQNEIIEATAVMITFLGNNFDHLNNDPVIQESIAKAKAWEAAYISYLKNYTTSADKPDFMDVAFNSERSIQDELQRTSLGKLFILCYTS